MSNLLQNTISTIKTAGHKILKIYHQNYKTYQKKDKSPVTEADLISDKIIINNLKKYNWPILSEESKDDPKRLKHDKVWIVDSLDGTMDFLQKTDEFSIMIGLIQNTKPILGVVYVPTKDKLYFAQKNKGAFLQTKNNQKKLHVSRTQNLSQAKLVVSRNHLKPHDLKLAKRMKIKHLKKSGSNGIKIGLIAEDRADLFFNLTNKMGLWDSCAPQIILEEAGGKITNTLGQNINYNQKLTKNKNGLVASNKILHNETINIINNKNI